MKKKGLILVGAMCTLTLASCGFKDFFVGSDFVNLQEGDVVYMYSEVSNKCYKYNIIIDEEYHYEEWMGMLCDENESVKNSLEKEYEETYGFDNISKTSFYLDILRYHNDYVYSTRLNIMYQTTIVDYRFAYSVELDNSETYTLYTEPTKDYYLWDRLQWKNTYLTEEEAMKMVR